MVTWSEFLNRLTYEKLFNVSLGPIPKINHHVRVRDRVRLKTCHPSDYSDPSD